MRSAVRLVVLSMTCLLCVSQAWAQDWPQWRGPNRDGIAQGFKAPGSWPEEMVEKWSVAVGDGVATPALVGGKLFVFARQDGNEVLRCLDAATGAEVWQDKYETEGVRGPASRFAGPRSPRLADYKLAEGGSYAHPVIAGNRIFVKDQDAVTMWAVE